MDECWFVRYGERGEYGKVLNDLVCLFTESRYVFDV